MKGDPAEHGPVCRCGKAWPCPDVLAARGAAVRAKRARARIARLARLEPGACLGCGESIATGRALAIDWPGENVWDPRLPVRFHARYACSYEARQYDLAWQAAWPGRTCLHPGNLRCPGEQVGHPRPLVKGRRFPGYDNVCSLGDLCVHPKASHRLWRVCWSTFTGLAALGVGPTNLEPCPEHLPPEMAARRARPGLSAVPPPDPR